MSLIMEFDQSESGREREEQEHRIEQDETGNTEPSDICKSASIHVATA
jgi:hypothetical protein